MSVTQKLESRLQRVKRRVVHHATMGAQARTHGRVREAMDHCFGEVEATDDELRLRLCLGIARRDPGQVVEALGERVLFTAARCVVPFWTLYAASHNRLSAINARR